MSAVAVVAYGAISALGEGADAVSAGSPGAPAKTAVALDDELARAGLARPFAARAEVGSVGWPPSRPFPDFRGDGAPDRVSFLLWRALESCVAELDRTRPRWRAERIGMILGTSSGGMRVAEQAFASIARGDRVPDAEAPTYFGPMVRVARRLRLSLDPSLLVLGACASGSLAIGLASRWLSRGTCDLVLAGGFDEVTVFVAAGFEALRATTASPPPRPFCLGRDGMALGEGAAVLALAQDSLGLPRAFVTGFGATSDGVHLTAPDREGSGLARAAVAALEEAGRPAIDLVSAHATATPFNDASESRAIKNALGERCAREVVVHPFKAQIGHTLGAAGALELLACIEAIARGVLPASAGHGTPDPDAPARLLPIARSGTPRAALKLASAFGGANAALVVDTLSDGPQRPSHVAFVHGAVHVDHEPSLDELARQARTTIDALLRADPLVRLALAAVARLEAISGPLSGAGVVVGSALATIETNALFASRIRERGAQAAEPRRFPYTSPNAVAGQCSIAFGLTGPSFAVGGGVHAAVEALAAASVLVESGDAERVVVVAVDDVGSATRALVGESRRAGSVALLVSARAGAGARARVGPITLRRGDPAESPCAPGHLSLLPLVSDALPGEVACASPPDMLARVLIAPL